MTEGKKEEKDYSIEHNLKLGERVTSKKKLFCTRGTKWYKKLVTATDALDKKTRMQNAHSFTTLALIQVHFK